MKNLNVQNFGIGEVTMNERIKELIEQAEDPEHGFVIPKKLAELIIEACLHQCYCRGMNDETYEGQLVAAEYIKEYFGVT